MRIFHAILVLLLAPVTLGADDSLPKEWVDPDTGHRIVRLSTEPNSASLYFNQNAYTADGNHVIITTPHGLATID